MISMVVVAVLVVIAVVLIKMNHFRHKVTIIVVLLFALFLYSTVTIVNKANEFDLTSTEGFFGAFKVYTGWLGNGFSNLKTLTGNAVKMDWSSTNGTFFSKEIDAEKR